jgi:hypothetical protein
MRNGNGIALPNGLMSRQPQPAAMQIAQPMNDVQLVSLVAAQVYGAGILKSPAESVDAAVEIVALAFAAQPKLGERIAAVVNAAAAPPG